MSNETTRELEADDLYEKLIAIQLPDEITVAEAVSAHLRATLVVANVAYDPEFYKHLLLEISDKSKPKTVLQILCNQESENGEN